jgi:subtilisin family serine protease
MAGRMSRHIISKKVLSLASLIVMLLGVLSTAFPSGLYVPRNLKKEVLEDRIIPAYTGFVTVPLGKEVTRVLLTFSSPPDQAKMNELGIQKLFGDETFFSAIVPWDNLSQLGAAFPGLMSIRNPISPFPHVITGQETGLFQITNFINRGFDGKGINVAVIDSGFYRYSSAVSAGELPPDCVTVNYSSRPFEDSSAGSDAPHGTACAEIIHEIAPGAKLTLIKIQDSSGLIQATNYCIHHDIHIVSHSMGWFIDGWGSGDGYIYNHVVDPLYKAGILWVNSAGNQTRSHFQADFNDSDGDSWYNFTPALNYGTISNVRNGDNFALFLNWNAYNDYYAGRTFSDYDLYVFKDQGTNQLFASSTETQPGYFPDEAVTLVASLPAGPNVLYYRIKRISGTVNDSFQVTSPYKIGPSTSERSIMAPADGPHTLTVAAVAYSNWNTNFHAEKFSSRGPAQDGRIKPDISGIDGVSGCVAQIDWGGNFFGTSAACPSIAGLSALLLSKQPYLTPYQVTWTLKDNADSSLMGFAPDTTNGWGKAKLILYPLERNAETLTTNAIVAPTRLSGSDCRLYYYGVTDKTIIRLRTLLGALVKDFGKVLGGTYAAGMNYIELCGLKMAGGVYVVEFIEPNGNKYARKIIMSR